MSIMFLYGTETGTAEIVCMDLQDACPDMASHVASLEDINPADLQAGTFYVLVCSTYGMGDLPASAEAFEESLRTSRPNLGHVRFAMFGLGDSAFGETFAKGSETLMQAMLACGARMVGERGLADASGDELPEDLALAWLKVLLQEHGQIAACANA